MAKSLEELIILKRTSLRYLLARESKLLSLGKKPINKKISNLIKGHEDNSVWSNFCDSLGEDLSRNLKVFEWRHEKRVENKRRRFRLFSETKEQLRRSTMFMSGGRMTDTPIVTVEQGQLAGRVASTPAGKNYYSFQGIPYAKPPLGSLRFKAPQPIDPWDGIRDATAEGNVSAQIDLFGAMEYTGDENCLFLNVYTPNLDGSFLPVMVYLHGGGLTFGSGNSDSYGPDYLVEKDVVVVTINYRLGALGFLCLNTPEVPGNAGVKDVITALKWVKENIHNFGGNAGNLTIFGESAGGALVSVLTVSPLSKNLISKAIVQSGSALCPWSFNSNPIGIAKQLAKALGCDAENVDDILEFLTSTPAKEIIEAQRKLATDVGSIFAFVMVVEKEFPGVEAVLHESVLDLLTSGRVAQVPTMIGSTTLEFATDKPFDDIQDLIPTDLNIPKDSDDAKAIAKQIEELYFHGNRSPDQKTELYQLFSDIFINLPTHRHIEYLLRSTTAPIYYYKFDYMGELNLSLRTPFISNGVKASMHLDDLGYLFRNDLHKGVEPTDQDLEMREKMVQLWTTFAKTGNPTPDDQEITTWPPVTKDQLNYLNISEQLTVKTNPDKEKMDYWDALYSKYFKIWDQRNNGDAERKIAENVAEVVANTIITESIVTSLTEDSVATVTHTETTATDGETIVTETLIVVTEDENPEVTDLDVVETTPEPIAVTPDPVSVTETSEANEVDAPRFVEEPTSIEPPSTVLVADGDNHVNVANGFERKTEKPRTSNEIKMVQNSNGAPKDVIRANDPPEDDLPKNIGVNKFVNFFESLGGKK